MEPLLSDRLRAKVAPAALRWWRTTALLWLLLLLPAGCVTEDLPNDTRQGNFLAFWQTLDEKYCFFPQKSEAYGLDWDEVRGRYAPAITEEMTERQLFEVLAQMSYELRDGHVNIFAAHDVARYGRWFDDYPANYADTLERIYLGRTEDSATASGLKYRILDDNIGYVRCATFQSGFGSGNLHEMMRALSLCDGLIVDVRSNGGGLLTAAQDLASLFLNERSLVGYVCHKTGRGHTDFSAPEAIYIDPFEGLRWQKPVVILTNRSTYSAANAFVAYLHGRRNVTTLGDRTGGGSGLPLNSELPNGWTIRFSACPMYDAEMRLTEEGIDPDVRQDLSPDALQTGRDDIIERARELLHALTQTPHA